MKNLFGKIFCNNNWIMKRFQQAEFIQFLLKMKKFKNQNVKTFKKMMFMKNSKRIKGTYQNKIKIKVKIKLNAL